MATTCECPYPPGGRAECADHQMAICVIENGRPLSRCVDPPRLASAGSTRYINWVLRHVTQQRRFPWRRISSADRAILDAGEYNDPVRGIRVTFRLPAESGGTTAGPREVPLIG